MKKTAKAQRNVEQIENNCDGGEWENKEKKGALRRMSNCVFSNLAVDNFAGLLNFHLLQYPLPRNATLFGNISHFQCSMLKNVDAYVPFAKYAYVIVRMVVVVVVELPLLLLEMCCVRYNTTISTRDK